MQLSEIHAQWAKIPTTHVDSGYRSIRASSESYAELFLGVDQTNRRCLLLMLPQSQRIDILSVRKDKLSLEVFAASNSLVLTLLDESFQELFDDLILSINNAIEGMTDPQLYTQSFVLIFHKWSEFFQEGQRKKLSVEKIQGIFGELLYLRELLGPANSVQINPILESWKGPYGRGHDFELDSKDVEVKTKSDEKTYITVNSEYQLDFVAGRRLELLVISVVSETNEGATLKDLVGEIKQLVNTKLGDFGILLRAIQQEGLTSQNIKEYDDLKFRPIKKMWYDCVMPKFPRLCPAILPAGISKVRYNLELSNLNQFVIAEEPFL